MLSPSVSKLLLETDGPSAVDDVTDWIKELKPPLLGFPRAWRKNGYWVVYLDNGYRVALREMSNTEARREGIDAGIIVAEIVSVRELSALLLRGSPGRRS